MSPRDDLQQRWNPYGKGSKMYVLQTKSGDRDTQQVAVSQQLIIELAIQVQLAKRQLAFREENSLFETLNQMTNLLDSAIKADLLPQHPEDQ